MATEPTGALDASAIAKKAIDDAAAAGAGKTAPAADSAVDQTILDPKSFADEDKRLELLLAEQAKLDAGGAGAKPEGGAAAGTQDTGAGTGTGGTAAAPGDAGTAAPSALGSAPRPSAPRR